MVDRIVTYMGASFPFFSGLPPQLEAVMRGEGGTVVVAGDAVRVQAVPANQE